MTESTEEAKSATPTAEEAVEGEPETGAESEGSGPAPEASAAEEVGAAAAEGVEIPKQQSAEEAADNEAGESARK
ncbi:gliding motility protein [Streptomyces sp. NPDC023838]|uniref:gliding motility protein n=1 Tax=Streptomyces sp. NPDC023838 TaxID=3154325 RepID=UPI0033C5EDF2